MKRNYNSMRIRSRTHLMMKMLGVLKGTNAIIECEKAIDSYMKAGEITEHDRLKGVRKPATRTILLHPEVAQKYRACGDLIGASYVDMLDIVWDKYMFTLPKKQQEQLQASL